MFGIGELIRELMEHGGISGPRRIEGALTKGETENREHSFFDVMES